MRKGASLHDYPVERFAPNLVGKTITEVHQTTADEGFTIWFLDGSEFVFGFSGCEGGIYYYSAEEVKSHAERKTT